MFKQRAATWLIVGLLFVTSLSCLLATPVLADIRQMGYLPTYGAGDSYQSIENYPIFQNFTAPANGTIYQLHAKIFADTYTGGSVMSIYNSTLNLLGNTTEITISADPSYIWQNYTLQTNVSVIAGQVYYFGVWSESAGGNCYVRWDNSEAYLPKATSYRDTSEVYTTNWEPDLTDYDETTYDYMLLVYVLACCWPWLLR